MSALRQAGTAVYEPVHRFRLEIPADTARAVLPVLARLRAVPRTSDTRAALCIAGGESRRRGCTSCSSSCRR